KAPGVAKKPAAATPTRERKRRRSQSAGNGSCWRSSEVMGLDGFMLEELGDTWHRCSGHDLFYHMPMHIGEPEIATGMAVGEALVIEAEQMQDGGMEIVDVHGVDHRFIAVVVGLAVGVAAFHAAAGHPHGEGLVIVI